MDNTTCKLVDCDSPMTGELSTGTRPHTPPPGLRGALLRIQGQSLPEVFHRRSVWPFVQ